MQQEHRRHLPERRQRRPQLLRADRATPSTASTRRCAPRSRGCSGDGHGRHRRHDGHARHRRDARVLQQARLGHGRRPATATPRASTRSTATARAARARISRSSRPPTTTRPTARTSRAATTGSPVRSRSCRPAGWAAGSTPTARRSNPLQAVSLDSNLSKQIRSSTAPVCALEGLQGVGFGVPGVTRRRQQRDRQARGRAVRRRATTRSPARAA